MKITKSKLKDIIKEEINSIIAEDEFDDYMQSIKTTSNSQQRAQGAYNKATAEIRAVQKYLLNECNRHTLQHVFHGHENDTEVYFEFTERDWPIRTAGTDEYASLQASEKAEDFYWAVSHLVSNWQKKDANWSNFRYNSPQSLGGISTPGDGPELVKCKLVIDKYIGLNPESGLKPLEGFEPELYNTEETPDMYTEGINNMKISKSQLKDIIKEELEGILSEDDFSDYQASAGSEVDCAKLEKQLQSAREQYKSTQPGNHNYYPTSEEDVAQTYDALNQISARWKAKCKGVNPAFKVTQRA